MSETPPLRYVAIGDSLSEGVGDDPWPDGALRGWTDRLAGLLAAHHGDAGREVHYANLAVRGYRSHQVAATQLEAAVAIDPDVVTLTAGMNDILRPRLDLDALHATLVELVAPFQGRAGLVIVPIPDIRRVMPVARLFESRRRALNEIYRDLSTRYGVLPIAETTGSVFEDPRAWAEDRLHQSALGHERLALAAAAQLGLPGEGDPAAVPAGVVPAWSWRAEAAWVRAHGTPWVGRRLRGESSGDGRVAKRPDLAAVPLT